jgi:hypothetical protein
VADVDLYALAPEDFTAARDELVKERRRAGDRAGAADLAALRRPSVSAHLVDLLVRAEPDLVAQLVELGGELAQAQRGRRGDALRALGDQRRALIAAVTARAVELGGRAVTPAVRAEVEATLEAALADPGAAQAVQSGRLVRSLAFSGFGGADLDGAVAPADVAGLPAAGTSSTPAARGGARRRGKPGPRGDADAETSGGRQTDTERQAPAKRQAQAERQAEAERRAQAERQAEAVRAAERAANEAAGRR